MAYRTDLAVELLENLRGRDEFSGVSEREYEREGLHIHEAEVTTERAARLLGKPCGRYLTLSLDANCKFVHESMRKKYAKISSDLQMGLTVAEAFHRFEAGTGSKDAKDLAVAIDVQDNVGGHEADVIKEVADNIYGRMMLRREIKSLFASTSAMSLYFSNPLYTIVFIILVAMMVIGSFINHKTIARIKKGA